MSWPISLYLEVIYLDVNSIMQVIGTVGFPIVACGAMFWLVNKLQDQHREDLTAIQSALAANTEALHELQQAIRGGYRNDLAG